MLNYKITLLSIVLLLLPLSIIANENENEDKPQIFTLGKKTIITSGDGKMVSGYDYIHQAISQVGGIVAIQSKSIKDLRKIKLLRNYIKGQQIETILKDFCLVFQEFNYKIEKNIVNIYYDKKTSIEGDDLGGYGYSAGSVYLSRLIPFFHLNQLTYSDSADYTDITIEPKIVGASFHFDWFIANYLSISFGVSRFGYKGSYVQTPDPATNYDDDYLSLEIGLNGHLNLFGVHTYFGSAVGYGSFLDVFTATKIDLIFRLGALVRVYKSAYFQVEFSYYSSDFKRAIISSGISFQL